MRRTITAIVLLCSVGVILAYTVPTGETHMEEMTGRLDITNPYPDKSCMVECYQASPERLILAPGETVTVYVKQLYVHLTPVVLPTTQSVGRRADLDDDGDVDLNDMRLFQEYIFAVSLWSFSDLDKEHCIPQYCCSEYATAGP